MVERALRVINLAWNSTIATNFKASKDNSRDGVNGTFIYLQALVWKNYLAQLQLFIKFRFILDKTRCKLDSGTRE